MIACGTPSRLWNPVRGVVSSSFFFNPSAKIILLDMQPIAGTVNYYMRSTMCALCVSYTALSVCLLDRG